jgi:uncharacterized membrane protein
MNMLLTLAFLFFIGSLVGWCIELVYRKYFGSYNPGHKWVNPGFLVGPYLPLYGTGLCILFLLARIDVSFIENPMLQKLVLFAVMAFAMTVIEYITGLIFIKGMKVRLWDYTKRWGNIQGIICPMFSFFWAVLGAVYYFTIDYRMLDALEWLSSNLAFTFFIGFFYGVFCIDVAYSMNVMAKIRRFADEHELVIKVELLQSYIRSAKDKSKEKARFIFAFKSRLQFREHLEKYLELRAAFDADSRKKKHKEAEEY